MAYADLPLHGGTAPQWLMKRMIDLSEQFCGLYVHEFGQRKLLQSLADPFWFQAYSCLVGFDWHSSGTTTTTCGALKTALAKADLGLVCCGGKGKASRKTPSELEHAAESYGIRSEPLVMASRCVAKSDSSLLQDGFELYHHCFFLSDLGDWAVVQQGMMQNSAYARRYHWTKESFSLFLKSEPHTGLFSPTKAKSCLNMLSAKSEQARKASVEAAQEIARDPEKIASKLNKALGSQKSTGTLLDYFQTDAPEQAGLVQQQAFALPAHHDVRLEEKSIQRLARILRLEPANYQELAMLRGIGKAGIRALALLASLLYGQEADWQDPALFSYAHGGKDGFPFPVQKKTYDQTIEYLKEISKNIGMTEHERLNALRKLGELCASGKSD